MARGLAAGRLARQPGVASLRRCGIHAAAGICSLFGLAVLAGCSERPLSTLDPASPGAASITLLWWIMFWGSMVILAGTVAVAVYGAVRGRGNPARALILGGGLVLPVAVISLLLGFAVYSGYFRGGQVPEMANGGGEVFRAEIIGHQWWWEVRYPDADGGVLHDANELHIPAEQPVDLTVRTADVIHSFWVPRLGGKIDGIPGQPNRIRLEADEPGVYHGVCAEFCGAQHARMEFLVEAHPDGEHEQRLAQLAERSQMFEGRRDSRGARAFTQHCAQCHSINAERREPVVGPNLTGLASRRYLGAGTLRHEGDALATWIRRHEELKPGNRMRVFDDLDDATVEALTDYLEQTP